MRKHLTNDKVKQGAEAALDKAGKSDESGIVTAVGQALIVGIFALFDELVVDTNFKCPCISPDASAQDAETSCEWNTMYSLLFIVLTTILAAFLGTAALFGVRRRFLTKEKEKQANGTSSETAEDTTKMLPASDQASTSSETAEETTKMLPASDQAGTSSGTAEDTTVMQTASEQTVASGGGQSTDVRASSDRCVTCPCTKTQYKFVVFQFFLIAAAWFSIICIDGDYIACAITCSPYGNVSCVEVRKLSYDELPFSKDFLMISRRISQPFGIVFGIAVAVAILSSAIRCSVQCKKGPCKEYTDKACCGVSKACYCVTNACCEGNTCCCCVFQPDVEQDAGDAQAKTEKGKVHGSSGQLYVYTTV